MAEPSQAELVSSPHAERQRVLYLCAGVILLFTLADTLALGHFSWLAFGSRVVWAAERWRSRSPYPPFRREVKR